MNFDEAQSNLKRKAERLQSILNSINGGHHFHAEIIPCRSEPTLGLHLEIDCNGVVIFDQHIWELNNQPHADDINSLFFYVEQKIRSNLDQILKGTAEMEQVFRAMVMDFLDEFESKMVAPIFGRFYSEEEQRRMENYRQN